MDVVCCDIRVVSSRKRRGERVGVGSRGKYPGAPPHHKGKRNQADRKRYLIGLLGEKGKAKKKKNIKKSELHDLSQDRMFTLTGLFVLLYS
jgi:hypothetical protein